MKHIVLSAFVLALAMGSAQAAKHKSETPASLKVASKSGGSTVVCTATPPKVKATLRKDPATEAPEGAEKSSVRLEGQGLHRVLKAEIMTPSAGYSWSVSSFRHQKDQTVVGLTLNGLQEGMMGATVLTPVNVSVPVALRPQTKSVTVRVNKDFKWGATSYTCPLAE